MYHRKQQEENVNYPFLKQNLKDYVKVAWYGGNIIGNGVRAQIQLATSQWLSFSNLGKGSWPYGMLEVMSVEK